MDTLNPKSHRYTNNPLGNGRFFELVSSVYLEFSVQFDARIKTKKIDHTLLHLIKGTRKEFVGTWQEYLVYCFKLPSSKNMMQTRNKADLVKRLAEALQAEPDDSAAEVVSFSS